jgi:hypothetical protein
MPDWALFVIVATGILAVALMCELVVALWEHWRR